MGKQKDCSAVLADVTMMSSGDSLHGGVNLPRGAEMVTEAKWDRSAG